MFNQPTQQQKRMMIRSMQHMPTQTTRSLFVGDLSFFCSELELAETFSRFGEVLNTEVKRSRGGDSLMHGFVDFARESDALLAIQHMNGQKLMGRKLKVNWTNQKSQDKERESWIQVHVNFLCPNIQCKITEEFLQSVFVRFGNIADISVKRHLCSFQPQQVTGYAFVYFFDAHTALRAIYGLRSGAINGVFVECCLSYKAEQLLKEVQGMGAVIKRQQTSNPPAFFKRFEQKVSFSISYQGTCQNNGFSRNLEYDNTSLSQQPFPSTEMYQQHLLDRQSNSRPPHFPTPNFDNLSFLNSQSSTQSMHSLSRNSMASLSSSSMSPKSLASFENVSLSTESSASSIFDFSHQSHLDLQQPLNFEHLSSMTTQFSDLIM